MIGILYVVRDYFGMAGRSVLYVRSLLLSKRTLRRVRKQNLCSWSIKSLFVIQLVILETRVTTSNHGPIFLVDNPDLPTGTIPTCYGVFVT